MLVGELIDYEVYMLGNKGRLAGYVLGIVGGGDDGGRQWWPVKQGYIRLLLGKIKALAGALLGVKWSRIT